MGRNQESSNSMSKPAIYQIEIEGRISESFSTRLEGMQITESQTEDVKIKTTLVGRLRDQAALSGILNTLYELHTSVISVTCLDRRH
jgi:hypothetical protein